MAVMRAAAPADLPRLAALGRWVWLQAYADRGVTASFAAYVDEAFGVDTLAERLTRCPMWVIDDQDEHAADAALQAWVELDTTTDPARGVELTRLYVAPPLHGRGLGARLLRQARQLHPDRPLWLSAWEGNHGALKFYRREGATLLGETWFELNGQRHRNEVLGWPALEGST